MTSNGSGHGGSKHGGGSSSGSKGAQGRDENLPKDSDSSEKALFWAAVSGMTALTGRAGSDDDTTTRGQSYKDSSSASPRSPAHSSEFGGEGEMTESAYRRGGGGGYDIDRARANIRELGNASPLPSVPQAGGTSGADSFCCKLASVLASDKRLGTQPIALRALQRAGVVDPLATVGGALASAGSPALAASLSEQLSGGALADRPAQPPARPPFSLPSDSYFTGRDSGGPSPRAAMADAFRPPTELARDGYPSYPTPSVAPVDAADALACLRAAVDAETAAQTAAAAAAKSEEALSDEYSVGRELARLRAAAEAQSSALPHLLSLAGSPTERLHNPYPISVMPRVETAATR